MSPTCSDVNTELTFGEETEDKKAQVPSNTMVSTDQLRLCQRQMAQWERENERLTSQLKEVISMNTQWQKYDEQREAYVLKLHAANHELLRKISSVQKTCSELQEQIARERLQEERPDISGTASPSKDRSKSSNAADMCALDARFARKEKELATLTDENERLREQVASLQRTDVKRRMNEEERISLFKAQLEVCMEDFRQERSDRERANKEKLRLRKQLDEADATITHLQEEISDLVEEMRWLQDRPTRLTHHYGERAAAPSRPTRHYGYYTRAPPQPSNYTKQMPVPQSAARLRARGVDVPDYDSVGALPSDVTVDGAEEPNSCELSSSSSPPVTPRTPSVQCDSGAASALTSICNTDEEVTSATPLSADGEGERDCAHVPKGGKEEEPLRCPQCLVEFAVEEHCQLLKHIELCSGDLDASQHDDISDE